MSFTLHLTVADLWVLGDFSHLISKMVHLDLLYYIQEIILIWRIALRRAYLLAVVHAILKIASAVLDITLLLIVEYTESPTINLTLQLIGYALLIVSGILEVHSCYNKIHEWFACIFAIIAFNICIYNNQSRWFTLRLFYGICGCLLIRMGQI